MDTAILVAVAAVVVIAVTARIAPKWHVAAPLVLVLVGIGVSFLPFVPEIEVEPELILAVVLPPLLFGSAVSMPAMNFRREFTAISGLAVALVIVSSVLLGFVFHLIIPSLDLAWCIALGAILSPTDAVATTIARGVGISSRVTTILEGESLLNDATALVTLRTAIAAAAASFSLWEAIGQFAYSVAIALVIGFLAGKLGVYARRTAGDATIAAVLSFAVPFVASVPTDLLQGSGLVAAVVAGIVTGRAKDRAFDPAQRLTATTMWNAVTLVLEGAVFLVMGLEIRSLVTQHADEADTIGSLAFIVVLAAFALVVMMLVRAAYMLPLVGAMGRNARRAQSMQPRMEAMESAIMDRDLHRAKQLKTPDPVAESETFHHRVRRTVGTLRHRLRSRDGGRAPDPAALESRWQHLDRSVRRTLSDIDYYTRQPLTMRDGIVMVGAGMRGAVTLAAAQTLPLTTPYRSSLVLVAFAVAVLSLLVQGSTLAPLVRWIKPSRPDPEDLRRQRQAVSDALAEVEVEPREGEGHLGRKLRTIAARRDVLLDLQDGGYYDVECTRAVLAAMDALELGLRLQLEQTADLEHGRPDPTRPGQPTTRSRDDADPFDGTASSPDADAPGLDAETDTDADADADAGTELDAELDAQLASMESDEREPDGTP